MNTAKTGLTFVYHQPPQALVTRSRLPGTATMSRQSALGKINQQQKH